MKRWQSEALLFVLVATTFWGYYLIEGGLSRQWAYYALQGALLAGFGAMLRRKASTFAGAWACVILACEGSQQALCGALHFGSRSLGDACVDLVGRQPYQALLSLSVSWLIVRMIYRAAPSEQP